MGIGKGKKSRRCGRGRKRSKVREISLRRNLGILRRIIPGCEEADEDTLFLKSIQHLMLLKAQVSFLRQLARLYGV